MGPFKCPDCGVWWAGFEHRCQPLPASTNVPITPPQGTTYYPARWGHCHGCSSLRCNQPDDSPCSLHAGGYTISNGATT